MNDCFCDYDGPDTDDDGNELYDASMVVATEPIKCMECWRPIAAGETYELVKGTWNGGPESTYRTCTRCLAVRQYVLDHVPCFCWWHQGLLSDARDTISEYAHELPGLFFGWARLHIAAAGRRGERAAR